MAGLLICNKSLGLSSEQGKVALPHQTACPVYHPCRTVEGPRLSDFTGIQPRPSASLTNTTLLLSRGVKRSNARVRSPGRIVVPCRWGGGRKNKRRRKAFSNLSVSWANILTRLDAFSVGRASRQPNVRWCPMLGAFISRDTWTQESGTETETETERKANRGTPVRVHVRRADHEYSRSSTSHARLPEAM